MGRAGSAFISIFIIFLASTGNANKSLLLNYSQLIDLTTHQRATYLLTIRKALAEGEHRERRKKQYSLWDSFQKNLKFIESANAQNVEGCIVAGWVGQFSKLSGKGICVAPGEAHTGCQFGQIKCNPAISGEGSCVSTETDTTETCLILGGSADEVAKLYLKDGELEKNWSDLKDSIEKTCNNVDQDEDTCIVLKERIGELEKKFSWLPKAAPDDHAGKGELLCKDRDQGGNGTCSGFCILCTLDALSLPLGFRTSANWVSLFVGVQNLCDLKHPVDPGDSLKNILDGAYENENLAMAIKFGFCDEETFLPYSDHEPPGGKPDKQDSPPTFRTQFGISPENAKALFCPNGSVDTEEDISKYQSRLRKLSTKSISEIDPRFIKCAQESLQTMNRLSEKKISCHKKSESLPEDNEKKNSEIKEILSSSHAPLSVEIKDDNWKDKGGKGGNHCMTIQGFDDKDKFFLVKNSWRGRGEKPLRYSGDDRIPYEISYLQCDGPAFPMMGISSDDSKKSTGH